MTTSPALSPGGGASPCSGRPFDDERFAAVRAELIGLTAGLRRLELAVAALPGAPPAAALPGRDGYGIDCLSGKGSQSRLISPCKSRSEDSADFKRVSSTASVDRQPSWPLTVQLHESLAPRTFRRATAALDAHRLSLRSSVGENVGDGGVEDFLVRQVCRCPVFDPNSYMLIPHKAAIIIALVHDLMIQPYVLAWDVPFSGEVMHTAEMAVLFWCLDLALNFFIGFYKDGELQTGIKVIGQVYIKSWFLPDLLAVVGDIMSLTEFVRDYLGRRFALRSIGILRVHKLNIMFDQLLEKGLSENWRMACKGMRLSFSWLWLNHIICCAWYSIGVNAPSDTGGRWVDTVSEFGEELSNSHALYRYATAFHWSMGQVTAGGIENLTALNSVERCYSIFILIFGVFTFSSIVSSLSTAMMQIQIMRKEQTDKMRNLRMFLRENAVTQKMAIRVQKQVAERMESSKRRLTERDVTGLDLLSATLRAELRFEISGPHLLRLPLLRICYHVDEATVMNLCGEAIAVMYLAKTDPLFMVDALADGCYFLIEGSLSYTLKANSIITQEEKIQEVNAGTWISEAAMWTKWKHVGSMEAFDTCEVLSVKTASLLDGLLKNELMSAFICEYGRQFHKRLMAAVPPRSPWPTDLHVPFTEYAELVLSMDPSLQGFVGAVTLRHVQKRQKIDAQSFTELVEEVKSGKCAVMMNGDGEMERGVSLTVLNVERENGTVLVHMGKFRSGKVTPQCQLPGAKQDHNQTPNEATEKLLDRLHPLVGQAAFKKRTEKIVEWKDSPTYGMRTRYFKGVHYATVEKPPEKILAPVPRLPEAVGVGPEIYVLITDDLDAFDFYSWLSQSEFWRLSGAGSGKEEVRGWLAGLDLESVHAVAPPSGRRSQQVRDDNDMFDNSRNDMETCCSLLDYVPQHNDEDVASKAPDSPFDPVKWEVEDWIVPELPNPQAPPGHMMRASSPMSRTSRTTADYTHFSPTASLSQSPRLLLPIAHRGCPSQDFPESPASQSPHSRSGRGTTGLRRFASRMGDL